MTPPSPRRRTGCRTECPRRYPQYDSRQGWKRARAETACGFGSREPARACAETPSHRFSVYPRDIHAKTDLRALLF
jgi:hypothetical protein